MVGIRRVKRFVQLSLFLLLFASIILLVQWNSVSQSDDIARQRKDFLDLTEERGERGIDVDKISQDVIKHKRTHDEMSDNEALHYPLREPKNPVIKDHRKGNNIDIGNLDNTDLSREEILLGHRLHGQEKNRNLKELPSSESLPFQSSILDENVDKTTGRDAIASGSQKTKTLVRTEGTEKATKKSHAERVGNGHVHWRKFPWTVKMLGKLNVHVWQSWCGSTIHDLRRNPLFPRYPDVHLTTKKLYVSHMEINYGQRVFGYIHPPVTGSYTFVISSDDASELWLSADDNPARVRLIAWIGNTTALSGIFRTHYADFTKYENQRSRPIQLRQGQKYFIEVLHKQARGREHLLVGWKIPGLDDFRQLTRKAISLFIDDSISNDITAYSQYIPEDLPSHSHSGLSSITLDKRVHKFGAPDRRDTQHRATFINESDVSNILPSCSYKPSYLVNAPLHRYDGVNLIHDTSVFPDDHSELKHMREYDTCVQRRWQDSHGNNITDLPADFTSNHSLYENGSIKIFSNSERSVALAFSKGAEEVRDAGRLLERQMDLLDIQKAADVEVMTRKTKAPETTLPKEDSLKFKKLRWKDSDGIRSSSIKKSKKSATMNEKSGESIEAVVSRNSRRKRRSEAQVVHLVKQLSTRKTKLSRKAERRKSSYVAANKSRRLLSLSRESATDSQAPEVPGRMEKNSSRNKKGESVRATEQVVDKRKTQNGKQREVNKPPSDASIATSAVQPSGSVKSVSETRPYHQHYYGPIDTEDARLSRLVSARQYVYLMQQGAQNYGKNVSAEALTEQVWQRFRVRLEVPAAFHIPDHSTWIYHQNSTKCASDVRDCERNFKLSKWTPNKPMNEYYNTSDISETVARSVAQRVMRGLKRKHVGKYSLKSIVNVEENHDVLNGDRYLVELDLNVKGQNSSVRLSRYVYQKLGSTTLCHPRGFQMNHHTTVHIIIPVKNQGKWVQFLIDDMSRMFEETRDPHVNIIIVDFESEDIDISAAFKRSSLQRYQLQKLKGPFQRAYGIQAGARLVHNPRDIIFMCDLHLEMPSNIIDIIRKHCVEGKMAFAPIVTRLHCGFTPSLPYGFWELQGYGLFAMYKSDFDRVGGMNIEEFGTSWGGEDWELLDRVLEMRMEVERLRIPNFYHFYHSKQGMWGNANELQYAEADWDEYDSGSDVIQPYDYTATDEDLNEGDLSEDEIFYESD